MRRRDLRGALAAVALAAALAGVVAGAAELPVKQKEPPVPGGLWHDHHEGNKSLQAAFAERHGFIGVWRAGAPGRQDLALDVAWRAFQAHFTENLGRGLRLVDIETYATADGRRWAGLFDAGTWAQMLVSNLGWKDFEKRAQGLAARGLLPVDIETWKDAGKGEEGRRWAGVFSAGKGPHRLTMGDTARSFPDRTAEMLKEGLALVDFEVYVDQGTPRYAGVFRAGRPDPWEFLVTDAQTFHRNYHKLAERGLRLADLETFHDGGDERYAALWRQGSGNEYLWVNTCPDPCRGSEELEHQSGDLRQRWKSLTNLHLVDFETSLEPGPPAGPGDLAAAGGSGPPPPAPRPAIAAAPRPAGASAHGRPAGPGDVTSPEGEPAVSHGQPLHDAGSTGPP